MNDSARQLRRFGRFGDDFQVVDVLADGSAFGVAINQSSERPPGALPAFRERLKANIVSEKHPALCSRQREKVVVRKLVLPFLCCRHDIHTTKAQLPEYPHREVYINVQWYAHQQPRCRFNARDLATTSD